MQCLLHRLINRFGWQVQQRADASGGGRTEMGDVIEFVLVQADALHEIDLNLVSGGKTTHEIGAGQAAMLCHCEDRRNVVAGM